MKLIALVIVVSSVMLIPSAAVAGKPVAKGSYHTTNLTVEANPTFHKIVAVKAPPLRLPNIAALTKVLAGKPRPVLERQSFLSARVMRFWEGRGRWLRATAHEKCWQVPWQRTCTVARASYRLHTSLRTMAEQRLWELDRTIENTGNWTRAMHAAQRPFPGTLSWLEFISNRECRACYTVKGGFVCNYGGSGACGPMQFMSGTFYGHADDARRYLASHGYIVAPEVWDWHNALGQALTAAFMRWSHIDGCHWCL